jgi:hypothetical protein
MANKKFPPSIGEKFNKTKEKTNGNHNNKTKTVNLLSTDITQISKKRKTVTFTYVGRETRLITKFFKKTNIRIAYKTGNSIGKSLQNTTSPINKNTYDKSGIYQLSCPDCEKRYIGQIARSFQKRFQEHLRDYKYNLGNSKFSQHLIQNSHSFGPINELMDVLHLANKGAMMNTLEKYHIYKLTKLGVQINDKSTAMHNILFETLIRNEEHRGHLDAPRH